MLKSLSKKFITSESEGRKSEAKNPLYNLHYVIPTDVNLYFKHRLIFNNSIMWHLLQDMQTNLISFELYWSISQDLRYALHKKQE